MPVNELISAIAALALRLKRPLRLMEVCGTHTVSIFKHGIRGLLPENIVFLSGPGCPVCVTPAEDVGAAIALSMSPGIVLATFGDMLRVARSPVLKAEDAPNSLYEARAVGADVRVVYSPLEALAMASENRQKKVVFFATGFETTSPLVAATLGEAERTDVGNFYIYCSHKLVPPALRALLESPDVRIDGLILPGHVSAIIGSRPYGFIPSGFNVPSVIAGFEAADILEGVLMLLRQIDSGRPKVEIQYRGVVREEGNPKALSMINEYFKPVDSDWRGIGVIGESGLELKDKYKSRNIKEEGSLRGYVPHRESGVEAAVLTHCRCGDVLRGVIRPPECPLFGKLCSPDSPVGPCMVSAEGSCAAYHRYGG